MRGMRVTDTFVDEFQSSYRDLLACMHIMRTKQERGIIVSTNPHVRSPFGEKTLTVAIRVAMNNAESF